MHIEFSVKNLAIALALAASLACGNSIKANSFDFGNLTGAAIDFNGTGGFSFTPGLPAANFSIGDGTAAGLDGSISGNFSIGAITSPFPGASVAPVSGSGFFKVFDGGNTLSASLSWVEVEQTGTGSTLNVNGLLNLTGITYSGSNADLLSLVADSGGSATLSFTFNPAESLSTLKTTATSTSFSGTVSDSSVPDSGSTALLIALGVVGIAAGAIAQRRRIA